MNSGSSDNPIQTSQLAAVFHVLKSRGVNVMQKTIVTNVLLRSLIQIQSVAMPVLHLTAADTLNQCHHDLPIVLPLMLIVKTLRQQCYRTSLAPPPVQSFLNTVCGTRMTERLASILQFFNLLARALLYYTLNIYSSPLCNCPAIPPIE